MPIVTLSHEIGAGGPEIGQKLAERLGLHYVDQELGTVYGVTRERIPQVEMMGLKKLSRGPLRERLASFIGGERKRREEEVTMAYIIAEPCINVKDKACVEVCPVDCIYEGPEMLYIHPDECIDCGACEPVCPVKAIFAEDETPEQWKHFIELNRQFFLDNPGVQPCTTRN